MLACSVFCVVQFRLGSWFRFGSVVMEGADEEVLIEQEEEAKMRLKGRDMTRIRSALCFVLSYLVLSHRYTLFRFNLFCFVFIVVSFRFDSFCFVSFRFTLFSFVVCRTEVGYCTYRIEYKRVCCFPN